MTFQNDNPQNPSPWRNFLFGVLGGAAGLLAMRAYFHVATGANELEMSNQTYPGYLRSEKPLQSISLVGQKYREGESSSEAVGRILYHAVRREDPKPETRWILGNVVHLLVGLSVSGIFHGLRRSKQPVDWGGGLLKGLGLWLFGDELMMPLFGVAAGPTAYPLRIHLHSFVSHGIYGVVSTLVTQQFMRIDKS